MEGEQANRLLNGRVKTDLERMLQQLKLEKDRLDRSAFRS
jgi:hypothetical protein